MSGTVIMIHGAFCAGWALENWVLWFSARGYRCLAPDLPHHDQAPNASPNPDLGTMSLLDYAAWLEGYIDALDLGDKPILIGHSMGGLLAQMLAARGRAKAIVLLAPSAPWGVLPSSETEIYTATGLAMVGPFWSQALIPSYPLAAEATLDRLEPAERRRVFSRFVPESGQATFEILYWGMDPKRASRVHPNDVRCPVLVLAGGRDKVNPASTVRQVALRYRDRADFRLFEGRSHWLHGEADWESLAAAAHDWMGAKA